MKSVREDSQRRLASHTHKRVYEIRTLTGTNHEDNSAGETVQTVLGTSDNHRGERTSRLHGDCNSENIVETNQHLKQEFGRIQDAMQRNRGDSNVARRKSRLKVPQRSSW
jgi:hypothetical protein